MSKCRSLSVAALTVFSIFSGSVFGAGEPQFQKIWEAIKSAKTTEDDPNYWLEIASQCNSYFSEVEKIKNPERRREFLVYYVDQFGRHGAQADIRWLLADVRVTLPSSSVRPAYAMGLDISRHISEEFSEAVVRRCLSDKDFLHRYYVAVLSTGKFIVSPSRNVQSGEVPFGYHQSISFGFAIRYAYEGLKKGEKSSRWAFLRRFVLLAYAVERDDLFAGLPPNELENQVPKFWEWILENKQFLRPAPGFRWKLDPVAKKNGGEISKDFFLTPFELPKKPFSDWKEGVPPPPVKLYSII